MWEVVPGKERLLGEWASGRRERRRPLLGVLVNRLPLWAAEAPPPGTSGDGGELHRVFSLSHGGTGVFEKLLECLQLQMGCRQRPLHWEFVLSSLSSDVSRAGALPTFLRESLVLLSPVSCHPQANPPPSAFGRNGVIPPGSGWGPCLVHICILVA